MQPLYEAEAAVAGRGIPSVKGLASRLTLASTAAATGATFDHSLWDAYSCVTNEPNECVLFYFLRFVSQGSLQAVLRRHVVEGLVDYATLACDADFDTYLEKHATPAYAKSARACTLLRYDSPRRYDSRAARDTRGGGSARARWTDGVLFVSKS